MINNKIPCKVYANEILERVKLSDNKKKLMILSVGDDPASQSYIKGKIKDCEYCGVPYEHIKCPPDSLLSNIWYGNKNPEVGGIIVQLPLPDGMNEDYYLDKVSLKKDVDGFRENSPYLPCTPEGIMYILHKELGCLSGKVALIVGRGRLVGQPISKMLLEKDCTVIVTHSKTKDLPELIKIADIIVSGVGKSNTVDCTYCKPGAIVIDAGINQNEHNKLVGDCYNFKEDIRYTPVPGGVGLMTRAMLMSHMIEYNITD